MNIPVKEKFGLNGVLKSISRKGSLSVIGFT